MELPSEIAPHLKTQAPTVPPEKIKMAKKIINHSPFLTTFMSKLEEYWISIHLNLLQNLRVHGVLCSATLITHREGTS